MRCDYRRCGTNELPQRHFLQQTASLAAIAPFSVTRAALRRGVCNACGTTSRRSTGSSRWGTLLGTRRTSDGARRRGHRLHGVHRERERWCRRQGDFARGLAIATISPAPYVAYTTAPRFFEVDSFQTLLPQAFFMLVAAGGILMTATDLNHWPHNGTPSLSEATS